MPTPISFTIDNLGDAADLQRGVITAPRPAGSNPALEQGYPALLELFARYEIPLTCFVEGWSARQYPALLQQLQRAGHEIGMHGWQHERWASLSPTETETLAQQATSAIQAALGESPRAFRAPGGLSTPFTRKVLAILDYDIDASHAQTNMPREEEPGLVSIPYPWAGVDATHWLWNKLADEQVETLWHQELEQAAARQQPFVFIWHPHVMGISACRLEIGARILHYLRRDERFVIVPLRKLRELAAPAPGLQCNDE
jgi:peptidoglycan-N-acetylglucosamine deacetylase